MIGQTSLALLPKLRDYTSHRVSSYDRSGHNHDYRVLKPGKHVLAEIKGPGCIKHIWMTVSIPQEGHLRRVVLRIYWDDCPEPSVECPLGDFFGMGHGLTRNFVSLPLQMSPNGGLGMNSWWAMPFRKKVIIEVDHQGEKDYDHYFYIDYEKYPSVEFVEKQAYFHAQWRREADTNGWAFGMNKKGIGKDPRCFNKSGRDNYVILETKGNGIYCGTHLDIDCFNRDWYGEGDDMIFIDGEKWPPSLHGTGTEDYFNCAYCPKEEYNALYHGVILYSGNPYYYQWNGKNTLYRYHIEDPIRFRKSILVSIEHGSANEQSNDYSSTAYYYLSKPQRSGPELLPVEKRLPGPFEEM